jgi:hypothetical protein
MLRVNICSSFQREADNGNSLLPAFMLVPFLLYTSSLRMEEPKRLLIFPPDYTALFARI